MNMLRYDTATLCINGDEADYQVRCEIYVEGVQAFVDHELEVLIDGSWHCARDIAGMDESRVENAEDFLCEALLEDDTYADYRPRPWYGREGARYYK